MKLLIAYGSLGKLFHLEEFSHALEKQNVQVKLVKDTDFSKGFPSKKIKDWFQGDKKFKELIRDFNPDAIFVDRQAHFALHSIKSGIPTFILLRGHYWFEVEATSYVSDEGDISAVLEAEYDLLLSQRLILQPRFETEVAVQDVEDYNIGSGITGFETGLRLRYEVSRKFAPYVGVSWEQATFETKDMLEADGEQTNNTAFVKGIKSWF